MELLKLLINLVDSLFIKSLFISIVSIMLAGKVLKTNTRNAFAIIKGIILVYAGLNIIDYLITYVSPATGDSLSERAIGPYNFAYYIMLALNTFVPLLLLYKKLGANKFVLLALSFLMNIGWIFETFVIYRIAAQRAYATHLSFNFVWFFLLNGFFVGSVIYAIGRLIKRKAFNIDQRVS